MGEVQRERDIPLSELRTVGLLPSNGLSMVNAWSTAQKPIELAVTKWRRNCRIILVSLALMVRTARVELARPLRVSGF
jgi:hypothetical protein